MHNRLKLSNPLCGEFFLSLFFIEPHKNVYVPVCLCECLTVETALMSKCQEDNCGKHVSIVFMRFFIFIFIFIFLNACLCYRNKKKIPEAINQA